MRCQLWSVVFAALFLFVNVYAPKNDKNDKNDKAIVPAKPKDVVPAKQPSSQTSTLPPPPPPPPPPPASPQSQTPASPQSQTPASPPPSSSEPSDSDKAEFLSKMTFKRLLSLGALSWDLGILGVIFIVAGLILTFAGRRHFKVFLAVVGFLAFGVAGWLLATTFHEYVGLGKYARYIVYALAIGCGCIGGALCMLFWKVGAYACGALGGFTLAVYIMGWKHAYLIENYIGRLVFIVGMAVVGAAAVFFFESIVLTVVSAIVGANAVVLGVDCFVNVGIKALFMAAIYNMKMDLDGYDWRIYTMFAAIAALAVCGIAVQLLLNGSQNQGFGRAG